MGDFVCNVPGQNQFGEVLVERLHTVLLASFGHVVANFREVVPVDDQVATYCPECAEAEFGDG